MCGAAEKARRVVKVNGIVEVSVAVEASTIYIFKLFYVDTNGKISYLSLLGDDLMKHTDIFNRLTGISCPVFGISWNPPESQREVARKIVIFLEARRVLYSPYECETPHPVVSSVVEIKNYLTAELPNAGEKSELQGYIRAMRNACNKFLSRCRDDDNFRSYACRSGCVDNWIFTSAIGEMRGVFGIMLGQIASAYGIDIEDDLAQIIPE